MWKIGDVAHSLSSTSWIFQNYKLRRKNPWRLGREHLGKGRKTVRKTRNNGLQMTGKDVSYTLPPIVIFFSFLIFLVYKGTDFFLKIIFILFFVEV